MSLGQLALHVATTPGGVAQMAAQPSIQVPEFSQPEAKTTAGAAMPDSYPGPALRAGLGLPESCGGMPLAAKPSFWGPANRTA